MNGMYTKLDYFIAIVIVSLVCAAVWAITYDYVDTRSRADLCRLRGGTLVRSYDDNVFGEYACVKVEVLK